MDSRKPYITKMAPSNPVHQLQNTGVNPWMCTTRICCPVHVHWSSKLLIILWKKLIIYRAVGRHKTIWWLFTSHFCSWFPRTLCTLCCQLACLRANKVKRLKQGYYKKLAARNQAGIWGEKDHDWKSGHLCFYKFTQPQSKWSRQTSEFNKKRKLQKANTMNGPTPPDPVVFKPPKFHLQL